MGWFVVQAFTYNKEINKEKNLLNPPPHPNLLPLEKELFLNLMAVRLLRGNLNALVTFYGGSASSHAPAWELIPGVLLAGFAELGRI